MSKIVTIFILVCAFFNNVRSQSFVWAQTSSSTALPSGGPKGFATCVDINGNTFTTGYFSGAKAVFGTYTLTNAGTSGNDFFIVKYDPNGNLLWAKSWGGTSDDQTRAICTDVNGNVIVTGLFGTSSLSIGSFTFANGGYIDMFLAKFDANGNPLWATIANGGKAEVGTSVSTDANGNVYVGGYFASLFLWFGSIILNNTNTSNLYAIDDAFIAKYDANGNLLWAKGSTGANADEVLSLEADVAGDVYVSGTFGSPIFSLATCTLTKSTPSADPFLIKLDANGNVIWGIKASGGGSEGFNSMSTDQYSNVYLTGTFNVAPISFGSITLNNSSGIDVFLVKYDANGNPLWACNSIGTGTFDAGYSVKSYSNDVFLIGRISGPSMTFGTHTINRPVSSVDPMFIAQFDKNGNCTYGTALESGGNNCGLALDKNCNAYITSGVFKSSAPLAVGTLSLNTTTNPTFLLAKFNYACQPTGSHEISLQNDYVSVFPNPTNGIFEISITEALNGTIEIIDVTGKIVYKGEFKQNNKIDITSQAAGVYSVVIKDEKGVLLKTMRIVKE